MNYLATKMTAMNNNQSQKKEEKIKKKELVILKNRLIFKYKNKQILIKLPHREDKHNQKQKMKLVKYKKNN